MQRDETAERAGLTLFQVDRVLPEAIGTVSQRWVGSPVARKEDQALLTGQARFIDDLSPIPGIRFAASLAWQVPMGQIAADTLRLAGAIVYEVTDPQAAAAAVDAAARIAFNGNLAAAVLLSQRMLGAKLFKD